MSHEDKDVAAVPKAPTRPKRMARVTETRERLVMLKEYSDDFHSLSAHSATDTPTRAPRAQCVHSGLPEEPSAGGRSARQR